MQQVKNIVNVLEWKHLGIGIGIDQHGVEGSTRREDVQGRPKEVAWTWPYEVKAKPQ